MTEKIVFDNGSIASKLLQDELKDAKVVKVSGTNLLENFTQFDSKKQDQRIYLPFTSDQLIANNEQIRKDIQKVEGVGFKNQVVLPYEGDDEKTIKYRAKRAGLIKDGEQNTLKQPTSEIKDEDNSKPYKTVNTYNTKVSDL